MAERAARDAEQAFGFISATIRFVDPASVEPEERIPGVSVPIRADLRAGEERIGLLRASLPATQTWERADQTLLDLFASEIGVAIRNAELFNQVQDQNLKLRHLSDIKDDFLRGVSHNLQTPLTSIRSNADALAATDDDPRLAIIAEQADRLSRMVQQLVLVGRLESQPPEPVPDVVAIAPRFRRAWDALGVTDRTLDLRGWRTGLARRRRHRPARSGPLGAARQRGQVRSRHGLRRDRCPPGVSAPVGDHRGPGSRARRRGSSLVVRPFRTWHSRAGERQRQRPRPLCLTRPHARDGWGPAPRPTRAGRGSDLPPDAPG